MTRHRRVLGLWLALGALFVASVAAPVAANAHEPAPSRHDQPLRDAMVATMRAGATGVIARVDDGHHVTRLAVGAARLHPRRHLSVRDEVRVGSITKTMVATIVLQLVGEGRLALGDTVEHWLPGLVPGGGNVTVRMLLNHTSGIFSYDNDPGFTRAVLAHPYRDWSPDRLIAIGTAHDRLFPPGQGWSYSNTGYLLLGRILEKVTGRSIHVLLAHRVLQPLHLRHTYFATSGRFRGRYAHGYAPPSLTGAGYLDVSHWSPTVGWAAGAVVSTAHDTARFYQALLSGHVLAPRLLRQMKTTVGTDLGLRYGLGVAEVATPCGTVWGHNGEITGYQGYAFTDGTGSRSAVVLVPTDGGDEDIHARTDYTIAVAVCTMLGRPVPTSPTAERDLGQVS